MLSPLMNNIRETPFGGAAGLGGQVPLRMNHCSKTKCCEKEGDDDVRVCVCSSVGMVEGRLGVGVYKCRGRGR